MNTYKMVGKRIKERRKKMNISQETLSELCNISPSYIGTIERGEKRLSVETLITITNVLHVSADYILGDSIEYTNTDYIDKTHSFMKDMDDEELKFVYSLVKDARIFMKKKKI